MAVREAQASWQGNLQDGKGTIRLGSGLFEGNFSFRSRFEDGPGTNPEELLGAALAGCYSMALTNALTEAGHQPKRVQTRAQVTFQPVGGVPTISHIHLICEAEVAGIETAAFERMANETEKACPVGRALAAVDITLEAKLTA